MPTTIVDRSDEAYADLSRQQQQRARMGGLTVELAPRAPAMSTTVILVDLSNLVHREFAIRQHDGDTDATAREVVAKVRRLAQGQEHVAICCDSGRSFRKDLNPTYKAQRAERDPSLYHQMRIVCERLTADGFPVWTAKGFEADDIIATATRLALERDGGIEVLLVTSDKDLTQLVGPRVRMKRPDTGDLVDEAGVRTKFGVPPSSMRDYLCLVGDASDNIAGAKGIGPKRAAELLEKFGSLKELYSDFDRASATEKRILGFTPAMVDSLTEFAGRLQDVRQLVTLRTDVEIPFDDLFRPRVSQAAAEYDPEAEDATEDGDPMSEQEPPQEQPQEASGATQAVEGTIEQVEAPAKPAEAPKPEAVTALVSRPAGELLPAYDQRLLPRDLREARIIAKDIHDAHLFSAFGSPQAVLTAVMLGAEFGMPPVAALRGVHIIEGKPSMSAGLMAAIVMKSGLAEYFEPVEISETSVTFETKRVNARNPLRITHTIEMARLAWNKGKTEAERQASWLASGWGRNPTDMLVARCQARLARYAYPDLLAGMYDPEELREIRDEEKKAS
jgi:5'-3' exonuclease